VKDPTICDITIHNARENNLRSLSCSIPRNQFVAVTGPSGSGKTSLVFDTLYRESIRRYSLALFANNSESKYSLYRPKVDKISGLSLARAIDRTELSSPLITVGSLSACYEELKTLFYYFGTYICPQCGAAIEIARRQEILQELRQIPNASSVTVFAPLGSVSKQKLIAEVATASSKGFSKIKINDTLLSTVDASTLAAEFDYPAKLYIAVDRFQTSTTNAHRLNEAVTVAMDFSDGALEIEIANSDGNTTLFFNETVACRNCDFHATTPGIAQFSYYNGDFSKEQQITNGDESFAASLLAPLIGKIELAGLSFAAALSISLNELMSWLTKLAKFPKNKHHEIFDTTYFRLEKTVANLNKIGLDYLALGRQTTTLSSGELQRVKLVQAVSQSTSGLIYCLDEPTTGLHPADVTQLLKVIRQLVTDGNSVIAVEHNPLLLESSDYLLELGPGAGKNGGQLLQAGPRSETLPKLASAQLLESNEINPLNAKKKHLLTLTSAKKHNLKNISLDIPLNSLVCITGVSGSGKSSLLVDSLIPAASSILTQIKNKKSRIGLTKEEKLTLEIESIAGLQELNNIADVTQVALGTNSRSTVATVAEVLDPLRNLFVAIPEAKMRGLSSAHFSFNNKLGACKACAGSGLKFIFHEQLTALNTVCDICEGSRFNSEVLEVLWKGQTIADVLNKSVDDATTFFSAIPDISKRLALVQQVGLGYLNLNQSSDSLSLGELQRLKIINKIAKRSANKTLFAFDEPTRGLARSEINGLLQIFRTLIQSGGSILAIEHNVDFIKAADHIIDLGPGAGEAGGQIVACGSAAQIRESKSKLAPYL